MRANREYRLIVTRDGRRPAMFAGAGRLDRIEVVEVESGEVILFWHCPAREASQRARALREDLSSLSSEAFLERWNAVEG
jgi:hypothetical protein